MISTPIVLRLYNHDNLVVNLDPVMRHVAWIEHQKKTLRGGLVSVSLGATDVGYIEELACALVALYAA